MRCTLLKIAASFAKSWFCFHLKNHLLLTALLCFTWTNSVLFQTLIFPSLNGIPCKNTFVDGCLQFYLTQKDFSVNMRPNGACKNTSAPLCFFCSKFALRNCDWRKFRLRVQVFDTKKTICTRFSGHCKNSFAPSFRISFYLKMYFWIDVCNAFSNNRTSSEMSILPLPPTYVYSVCSKFTHSVHYSGACLFNNGGMEIS